MGLPKNYRKNLKITPTPIGFEARQNILNDIANPGTYLPKGILHEDMDRDFIDYVENDLNLVLGGEKVPVIFLSIQRWAEFAKTWTFSDEYKNVTMPFITIVRKPDAQVGTNYAGAYNIPGKPTFTYMKIPTWDGNIKSFDVYKIPQPVSVDLNYEVRLFCTRMRDLNLFNRDILESFSAGQKYLRINGHPIPLMLDSIGDESVINNLDEKRYYVQLYTIKMMGYLLDERSFEVTPAISRGIQFYELTENTANAPYQIQQDDESFIVEYNITFLPGVNIFEVTVENNIEFNSLLTPGNNVNSSVITVNGVVKNIPFTVESGDDLKINIVKDNVTSPAYIQLKGQLL